MVSLADNACEDQYPPSYYNDHPEYELRPKRSRMRPMQKWEEKVLGLSAMRIMYDGGQRLRLQWQQKGETKKALCNQYAEDRNHESPRRETAESKT